MKHVAGLDGLRAIAVAAVVVFHAGQPALAPGGFLGVDLFFVLSGFLITGILAREFDRDGTIALGGFYLRRALRLMPALVLLVAVYLLAAPLVWPDHGALAHARDAAVTLTYLSDYGYALWHVPEYLSHSWSLSVEEHFYLVWPLLLPVILRLKRPARAVALLYLVAAAWRAFAFIDDGWSAAYYRFDVRFAGILLGCWLALWLRERGNAGREAALPVSPLVPAGALVLAFLYARWGSLAACLTVLPLAELAAAALILGVVRPAVRIDGWFQRLLASGPLTALGRLSYGVYLWHYPIVLITRETMPLLPSLLVCAAASVALAWLSWNSVEALGRRWRGQLDSRGRTAARSELVAIRH